MKKFISIRTLALGLAITAVGCDVAVEEKDSLTVTDTEGNFEGVTPGPALEGLYADLRGFGAQDNLYALLEVSSDEFLVPTRGTDWGDNGIWRTLHQHTWDPAHAYVLSSWNNLNGSVFRANQVIAPVTGASAQEVAEAKFLRAFNMWYVLDLFGQVPFRDVDDGKEVDPMVMNSIEAYDFIMSDINAAIPDLPEVAPGGNTIRASKAAGYFLKAKVLLNKHIYTGGTPDASDMNEVIAAVDNIIASGFGIHEGFFDIFVNANNNETIFWTDSGYGNRIWNGLHYNQTAADNGGGGWNGFSTTAEFYALFEGSSNSNEPGSGQEERRGFVPTEGLTDEQGSQVGYGFLVGQQYDMDGSMLQDRAGNPLVFTGEFPGLTGNNERTGIRVIKYHPTGGSFNAYYVLMRYSDALLMKAEAILNGGTSSDDALTLVNRLRAARGASALGSLTAQDLLDERGRELYGEGWRRNDQIRFGTFTSTWDMKTVTEDFRTLFPIPATALTSNPNLVQNPGY